MFYKQSEIDVRFNIHYDVFNEMYFKVSYGTHTCKKKSINITELRKNPAKYFIDEPVAVLSNNRPAGYMVSAKVFEELIDLLEEKQGLIHTASRFRPSAERLSDIADSGHQLLQNASDKDLTEFTE